MKRCSLPLLILTLFAGSAHAGADFCARLVKAPTISLEMGKPVRQYRHDQSIDELTIQAKGAGAAVADGGMVTGLTSDQRKVEVKAWFSVAQVPDGFCVSPQALVRVSDRRVTVAMPREIPSTSCLFQATIEHEHKHAKVAEVEMDRIVGEEVAKLQREFQGQYGFYQNLQNAQDRIDQIRVSVERRVMLSLDRVSQLSSSIDTPAEYARVQSLCKDRPEPARPWWKFWH